MNNEAIHNARKEYIQKSANDFDNMIKNSNVVKIVLQMFEDIFNNKDFYDSIIKCGMIRLEKYAHGSSTILIMIIDLFKNEINEFLKKKSDGFVSYRYELFKINDKIVHIAVIASFLKI